jgi:hypothetical protein
MSSSINDFVIYVVPLLILAGICLLYFDVSKATQKNT